MKFQLLLMVLVAVLLSALAISYSHAAGHMRLTEQLIKNCKATADVYEGYALLRDAGKELEELIDSTYEVFIMRKALGYPQMETAKMLLVFMAPVIVWHNPCVSPGAAWEQTYKTCMRQGWIP